MNNIALSLTNGSWIAEFTGPHSLDIVSLFGTNKIPTPFTSAAPASRVLAEVQQRNPGVQVEVRA